MIINVVSVPLTLIAMVTVKALFKCCDRGCTCRKERTKKKTQKAWENLNTGPEFLIEFRYSQVFQNSINLLIEQILTMIFVCMFYSSGVALLYISTFVNLFIFYWLDKICSIKFSSLNHLIV